MNPFSIYRQIAYSYLGPVKGNVVTFTNTVNKTAFVISAPEVERHFHIKQVRLLNDFSANGYGLLTLGEDEVTVVCEAKHKVDYPAPIGMTQFEPWLII